MTIGLQIEAPEGCSLTRRILLDIARAQVVASLYLEVANLEELMLFVVYPPREVERSTQCEVPMKRIVFDADVWYRTIAVLSEWYIDTIEQEVGLY